MRSSRRLVVAILAFSISFVSAMALWWWVVWPTRTAWDLQKALLEGESDAVLAMFLDPDQVPQTGAIPPEEVTIQLLERDWDDIANCRVQFILSQTWPDAGETIQSRYQAQKNQLTRLEYLPKDRGRR